MKKLFIMLSSVILIFCLMWCGKVFSQDYYSIVADSYDDSVFCARHNPFFDFETQGFITGSTIPDRNVALHHGSMNQLQGAIKLVLGSAFGHTTNGILIDFNVVVDTLGVARGVIVNTANPISKVALAAARVTFNYLKTKDFVPASLRGRPVTSTFPVVYRIREGNNYDATIPALESWPLFSNDDDFEKMAIFLKEKIRYDDTISKTKVVYVKCVVDTLGYTHRHVVTHGASPSLDKEAIRVCRLIKFDNPAMQNGHPVSVDFTIPVVFEAKKIIQPKHKRCLFKF